MAATPARRNPDGARQQQPHRSNGMDEVSAHLNHEKYRGSFSQSLGHATLTFVHIGIWHAIAWMFVVRGEGGSRGLQHTAGKIVLTVLYALFVVRAFIVFHDCGHRSLFQGFPRAQLWNTVVGHLHSCICITPTDWAKGHNMHHQNSGNRAQDTYEWCETVFQTAAEFRLYPRWKQVLWSVVRSPLVFFTFVPVIGWWGKHRIPINFTPRESTYGVWDKMFTNLHVFARHAAVHYYFDWEVHQLVFVGEVMAAIFGTLLFHMQHVFEGGYVVREGWNNTDASLLGSSLLTIPTWLRWATLGIEYHHIHHLTTRIPGYCLHSCHEDAPAGMWSRIYHLSYSEMLHALQLQTYDETIGKYCTYAEALRQDSVPPRQPSCRRASCDGDQLHR